ncbi:MAG: IPT/TIG domain-containing protein [Candidatus Doudnabacteria bacterium]|nr:IPT/TIG domain-containing protein [Candidatus Doudnabacteria bacterium]
MKKALIIVILLAGAGTVVAANWDGIREQVTNVTKTAPKTPNDTNTQTQNPPVQNQTTNDPKTKSAIEVKISNLDPSTGRNGTVITITGSGFTTTGNTVHIGTGSNSAYPGYSATNGKITFKVPNSIQPGSNLITVSNSNGTSNALTFFINWGDPPEVFQ